MRQLSKEELDSIRDAPAESIEPFKSLGDIAQQVLDRLSQHHQKKERAR